MQRRASKNRDGLARNMTEKQLTAALSMFPRMQERARRALHLVLVEGYSVAEAARTVAAKTKQPLTAEAVRQWVERVKTANKKGKGCPDGWEVLNLCLPKPSVFYDQALALEREAFKRIGIRKRGRSRIK